MTFEEYYIIHVFNAALDGVKKELDESLFVDVYKLQTIMCFDVVILYIDNFYVNI